MALIFETMTGEPFDIFRPKGGKETEQTSFTHRIENGEVELTARGFLGDGATDATLSVHFYQDGGEGRRIDAPKIKFSVLMGGRIVAVRGFSEKGQIWGSELIKEQEAVMVFFKKEEEIKSFFVRNDLQPIVVAPDE